MSSYLKSDDPFSEYDGFCPNCGAKLVTHLESLQPVLRSTNTWNLSDQSVEYRPVKDAEQKNATNRVAS
jgi:hypothetical protein